MSTPSFTAEFSLYRTSEQYHALAGAYALPDRQRVLPQQSAIAMLIAMLRGIGFCMAGCEDGDFLCLFDCLRG